MDGGVLMELLLLGALGGWSFRGILMEFLGGWCFNGVSEVVVVVGILFIYLFFDFVVWCFWVLVVEEV